MSKEINDLYEHIDKINTRFSNFWLRYIETENEIKKISKRRKSSWSNLNKVTNFMPFSKISIVIKQNEAIIKRK